MSMWFPWSSRINFIPFRVFRGPLFPKPITGQDLFFAVSYFKPALVSTISNQKILWLVYWIKFHVYRMSKRPHNCWSKFKILDTVSALMKILKLWWCWYYIEVFVCVLVEKSRRPDAVPCANAHSIAQCSNWFNFVQKVMKAPCNII